MYPERSALACSSLGSRVCSKCMHACMRAHVVALHIYAFNARPETGAHTRGRMCRGARVLVCHGRGARICCNACLCASARMPLCACLRAEAYVACARGNVQGAMCMGQCAMCRWVCLFVIRASAHARTYAHRCARVCRYARMCSVRDGCVCSAYVCVYASMHTCASAQPARARLSQACAHRCAHIRARRGYACAHAQCAMRTSVLGRWGAYTCVTCACACA
jgi:hypothetical protein